MTSFNLPTDRRSPPNTGDGSEGGTSWYDLLDRLNKNGTAEVDFGAFPGASDAQVVITGQSGIRADSIVEAWVVADATDDHSIDEHLADPPRVMAGGIVAGVGFTIYATTRDTIEGVDALGPGLRSLQNFGNTMTYGKWTVQWRWM